MKRFFRITRPLLNPTMLFVLVTDVIGSFQIFDTVYVMTQGGPASATAWRTAAASSRSSGTMLAPAARSRSAVVEEQR